MLEETVFIRLASSSYSVDARFTFFNEGSPATLSIGFPKFGYGIMGAYQQLDSFHSFETWVNEKPVQCRELRDQKSAVTLTFGDMDYPDTLKKLLSGKMVYGNVEERHWLVKEVFFPGKAVTRTRVRYTSPYQRFIDCDSARYRYGTGRSWAGKIGRARFIISKDRDVHTWRVRFTKEDTQARIEEKTPSRMLATMKNVEPDFEDEIEIIKDFNPD